MLDSLRLHLQRWHAWQRQSVNRRIFGAILTVGSLGMSVRLVLVVKELYVAHRFGTSDALDAFLTALVVPVFAVGVIAGSFNAALIPTLVRVHEREGQVGVQRLLSSVMLLVLFLLFTVTALLATSAGVILPLLGSRFSPDKLALTRHLYYLLLPVLPIGGLSTIWSGVLNAGERFALSAIAPAMTPLAPLALLALRDDRVEVNGLALATVCGYSLEALVVALAVHRQGYSHRLRWHASDAAVRQIVYQYLPMVAGAFMMSSTTIVDQAMAARLGAGSVSALTYGNRLVGFLVGLGSLSLSTAVLPHFSRMVARADWASVRHTFHVYLRLVLLITVPIAAVLAALSLPIVRVMFQRGAFTSADSLVVSHVQALYVLQVPFYLGGILVVRLLSSLRSNHIMMIGAVLNMVVNISLDLLFMRWIGVAGIALSTAVVYLVSFAFLLVMLYRRLPGGSAAER